MLKNLFAIQQALTRIVDPAKARAAMEKPRAYYKMLLLSDKQLLETIAAPPQTLLKHNFTREQLDVLTKTQTPRRRNSLSL